MARLSLSLLGSFQITLNGELIRGFKSNKVRALLAYLAVESGRPHPREILAGLLWPNLPDRAARTNLRTALYDLRQNIADQGADPPHLLVAGDTIQFNRASDSWLDVEAFKRYVAAGRESPSDPEPWQRAIELYQGPFLEGFSLDGCLAFEEWVLVQREVLSRQMISALGQLAACYERRGQYAEVEVVLRQQLELEPLDEAVHRRLISLLAASGQRTAALAQYKHCQQILAGTLDVRPSARTRKLSRQIRDCDTGRGVGPKGLEGGMLSPPSTFSTAAHFKPKTIFVGFEKELAHLDHHLQKALAGNGQVVFVTGESGRGKTMLLAEFCRRALKAHGHLLAAAGRGDAQHGHGDPYQPFREALRMLSGSVETTHEWCDVTEEHSRRLKGALPAVLQTLVEQGPDLIGNFLPVENLARLAQEVGTPDEPWRLRLEALAARQRMDPSKISPTVANETAAASSLTAGHSRAAATGPALNQAALFDQLTKVLQALSMRFPLILALDDLQWADAGSASLLFHLGRRLEGFRILIIGAYRPVEVALGCPANGSRRMERHPLEPVVHEFQRDFGDIQIDLNRFDGRGFVKAFLDSEPNRLDRSFRKALYRHSGGNPLFTVELLRSLQERGQLVKDADGRWIAGRQLEWDQLPARVEAVVGERFGRLPPGCQSMLATASLQGQNFIADVVAQAQSADGQAIIGCLGAQVCRQHRLVQAVGSEQVDGQHVSRFRFRHQLFQQYAYQQMDAVTKDRMHEGTALALETLYAGQLGDRALELGQHFEAVGWAEKAAGYFLLAGKRAYLMAANKVAIAHFRRGLSLLAKLPESSGEKEIAKRNQLELALQMALSAPLRARQGFTSPEVGQVYARACDLARQIGDADQQFTAQLLLWTSYLASAKYQQALEVGKRLYVQAKDSQDKSQLAQANLALGMVRFYLGEFRPALTHLEAVISGYDPRKQGLLISPLGQDIRIASLISSARLLWYLGYPQKALGRSQEAIAQTQELDHPYSTALALGMAGCQVHLLRREYDLAQEQAEALLSLASKEKLSFHEAWGRISLGRAQVANGQVAKGRANLQRGLARCQEIGQKSNGTFGQALLAEVGASVRDGLDVLAEAEVIMAETGERFYEAEICRLQGELYLKQDEDRAAAEACFQHALAIARRQEARSLELRAAMSLARLRQCQGRVEEARVLLAEAYDWFTEGFDTADLKEARELLKEFERRLQFEGVEARSF